MNIGFIGLGHMGTPMVLNLLKQRHQVTVFDVLPEATAPLAQHGAIIADSLPALAADQKIIFTMLQTHQQVANCCLGEQGLFKHINDDQALFIDSSTVDIFASRALHQQAHENGIAMIDAPVSGGVAAAKAATLTFMVGGEAQHVEQARPILQQLGKNIVHAGPAGNGSAAKICNNLILGVSMIAVSEAFVLAKQLGLSSQTLFDICSNASGQCWSLTSYCPAPGVLDNVPSSHDYQPGFSAQMMLKDLVLAQQAADQSHTTTPLGEHALQLYQQFVDNGHAERDFSAIITAIEQSADGITTPPTEPE